MKYSKFVKAVFVMLSATMLMASAAYAQSKTLVVDYNKVANQSKAGKSIISQLKVIQKTIASEYEAELKSLQAQGKQLQESTKNLPKNTDINTRPDLKKKIQSFAYKKQKTAIEGKYKDAEMQKTQNTALKKVFMKMDAIIANVAKERGADIVVDVNSVFYSSSSVDITSTVMSRLDSQLPYVQVTRERITRKPLVKKPGK